MRLRIFDLNTPWFWMTVFFQRGDLEKKRADIAEEKVARLQERINRAAIDEAKISLNARETQEALQRELASVRSDLQQAEDELKGALVAEKVYTSTNNERIALLAEVTRLEKERDELRDRCIELGDTPIQVENLLLSIQAAEACIREEKK